MFSKVAMNWDQEQKFKRSQRYKIKRMCNKYVILSNKNEIYLKNSLEL